MMTGLIGGDFVRKTNFWRAARNSLGVNERYLEEGIATCALCEPLARVGEKSTSPPTGSSTLARCRRSLR